MNKRALIVDDESDIRALLEITLSRMGLETCAAASLAEARAALASESFSLCLTDMRLPDGLGIELVREINSQHDELPVAVITAYGNMEDAVDSLKAGAFDFVTKPVEVATLRRLVDSALRSSNERQQQTPSVAPVRQLTGKTAVIETLRQMIRKLARNQAPVHIRGESGTGKELVAHLIHAQSARAQQAFVPINCGAIPAELIESELFGHVKGSFTGAVNDHPGLFRAAEGGTLFLDEVGDLPLAMQVKLLRAIQERKIRPVGGSSEINVDVRIISATHRNLKTLVSQGQFREDLYYRLNVIELTVPALRARREDIPLISQELLKSICQRDQTPRLELSPAALDALYAYDFPGNIRELENILERASALADGQRIEPEDLQLDHAAAPTAGLDDAAAVASSIDDSLAQTERRRIQDALEKTRYNKTKAAELLGISFRSLRYRLKKLDIE